MHDAQSTIVTRFSSDGQQLTIAQHIPKASIAIHIADTGTGQILKQSVIKDNLAEKPGIMMSFMPSAGGAYVVTSTAPTLGLEADIAIYNWA